MRGQRVFVAFHRQRHREAGARSAETQAADSSEKVNDFGLAHDRKLQQKTSTSNTGFGLSDSMQRGSPQGQDFPLRAAVADQDHGHCAGLLIHLGHQP